MTATAKNPKNAKCQRQWRQNCPEKVIASNARYWARRANCRLVPLDPESGQTVLTVV